eukprot:Clim_evm15s249 gene=Clim_evmTU15s249
MGAGQSRDVRKVVFERTESTADKVHISVTEDVLGALGGNDAGAQAAQVPAQQGGLMFDSELQRDNMDILLINAKQEGFQQGMAHQQRLAQEYFNQVDRQRAGERSKQLQDMATEMEGHLAKIADDVKVKYAKQPKVPNECQDLSKEAVTCLRQNEGKPLECSVHIEKFHDCARNLSSKFASTYA